MKATRGERNFNIFNCTFLSIISFTFLFPFWRIIVLSLNEGHDSLKGGVNIWPRKFTLDNFIAIFSKSEIVDAYKVTVGRTVIATILSVFLTALMAYGLSKNKIRGRKIINVMLIITMFFSGGLIPTYMLYLKLGLLDSFWVYIVPSLYGAYTIFIFRAFFRSLSQELEESAKIDGASDLTVFFRIVFPLSMPIFATMSLFAAVAHWNDYLTGVLFITNRKLVPLQTFLVKVLTENQAASRILQGGAVNLSELRRSTVTPESVKMAILVTAVVPIMCVYPFLQKYFVKGIMIGSLKG